MFDDINDFNFDNITESTGIDILKEDKKSSADERFYTLPKKSDGSGSAIIAFIPDKHKNLMVKMYKIRTTINDGKRRRWLNTWSPKSIGLPCPFNETYLNYYDEDPNMARNFKPIERYICNIKVIKDTENRDNEGKIFLYELSKTLAEKIKNALTLSDEEKEMGASRKEIFNPFKGWVFNLKCSIGDNGITDYGNSSFSQLPEGRTIYNLKTPFTEECKKEGMDDMLNKAYDLSEFHKPENFMSYDDLTKELERICNGIFGIGGKKSVQVEQTEDKVEKSDELTNGAVEAATTVTKAPEVKVENIAVNNATETPKAEVKAAPPSADEDLDGWLAGL